MRPGAKQGGRKPRSNATEIRKRLVTALIELRAEGKHVPTLELIAERAGCHRSYLYRYFDSMEHLHVVAGFVPCGGCNRTGWAKRADSNESEPSADPGHLPAGQDG